MTDLEWQEENTRYLSAAIGWVRNLLERCAGAARIARPPHHAQPKTEERASVFARLLHRKTLTNSTEASEMVLIAAGPEQAFAEPSARGADPPALVTLRQRLGLT